MKAVANLQVRDDHVVELKLQMTIGEMRELQQQLSDARFFTAGGKLHTVVRDTLAAASKHFAAEHPSVPQSG